MSSEYENERQNWLLPVLVVTAIGFVFFLLIRNGSWTAIYWGTVALICGGLLWGFGTSKGWTAAFFLGAFILTLGGAALLSRAWSGTKSTASKAADIAAEVLKKGTDIVRREASCFECLGEFAVPLNVGRDSVREEVGTGRKGLQKLAVWEKDRRTRFVGCYFRIKNHPHSCAGAVDEILRIKDRDYPDMVLPAIEPVTPSDKGEKTTVRPNAPPAVKPKF